MFNRLRSSVFFGTVVSPVIVVFSLGSASTTLYNHFYCKHNFAKRTPIFVNSLNRAIFLCPFPETFATCPISKVESTLFWYILINYLLNSTRLTKEEYSKAIKDKIREEFLPGCINEVKIRTIAYLDKL